MVSTAGGETQQPSGDVWPVGRVATELGVSAITLRMWERRYGIGPSLRTNGKHRRYTSDEVARLRRMVALIKDGTSAADAARASHTTQAFVDVDEVLRCVEQYRVAELTDRLDHLLHEVGAARAWQDIIRPSFDRLDRQFAEAADCADLEIVLTSAVAEAAQRHHARHRAVADDRPILLMPCPEEHHTLPLLILHAVLLEQGRPVLTLAAGSNDLSSLAAARRSNPAVVVLWSVSRRAGQASLRNRLEAAGVRTLTAGPGWPSPARDVNSLDEAVAALVAQPAR